MAVENVPPIARGTICVDFDGTLVHWGPLDQQPVPIDGAVQAVKAFKKAGWRIVIYTSRMSVSWWISHVGRREAVKFGMTQHQLVVDTLTTYGVPYDDISAEKVPAEWYIDDRAIEFRGNWDEVRLRVLGGPA